jgi:hypothetical protein
MPPRLRSEAIAHESLSLGDGGQPYQVT